MLGMHWARDGDVLVFQVDMMGRGGFGRRRTGGEAEDVEPCRVESGEMGPGESPGKWWIAEQVRVGARNLEVSLESGQSFPSVLLPASGQGVPWQLQKHMFV